MWCYSYGVNKNHDSKNCHTPVEDHQKDATFDNMMRSSPFGMKYESRGRMCNKTNQLCSVKYNKNTAYLDSGCTSHYFGNDDPFTGVKETTDITSVALADGGTLISKTTAKIPIDGLSDAGQITRIFDDMRINLILLRQLCDDNCTVI